MIILFCNQKGGCGKSTNAVLFCNYLSEKGKDVLLIDADFQRTASDRREDDLKIYENEPSYEIIYSELDNLSKLVKELGDHDDIYICIDLPGKIDEDAILELILAADYIITPFSYDKNTMDSTGMFIKTYQYLKENENSKFPQIIFLPNRIKNGVKYDNMEQINKKLLEFGFLAPIVPDRVIFERYNTLLCTDPQKEILKNSYEFIYSVLNGEY